MLKATNINRIKNNKDWKYIYDEAVYIHRFTIERSVLYGIITVSSDTSEAFVDVLKNDGTPYNPFYYIPCGNYKPMMNRINARINSKLKYYGIEETSNANNTNS